MSLRTLYHRDDCPFCWKVRLAFAMSSVNPGLVEVERGTRNEIVDRLSSSKTIPVYKDDEVIITQSQILVEYISDAFCKGRLFLGDAAMKANIRSLCDYSDKEIGKALRGLIFEKRDKPQNEWDRDIIEQSQRSWNKCLDKLENEISGPHFFGLFSAADCALLPRFALAERYGAGVTQSHPQLFKYSRAFQMSDLFIKTSKAFNRPENVS